MVNINTGNLGSGLLKEAISRAKDGNIDAKDLTALIKTAEKNNLSKDEKAFLIGLMDQSNVTQLKSSTSNQSPISIQFNEPSANATKNLEIDMQVLSNGGDENSVKKINQMNPQLREKFSFLLNNVSNKSELISLLNSGKLTMLDSTPRRVMENISDMIQGPNKPGVNGKQLAEETISILNDRNNITQGQHGTCGAGALQNHLWSKDPAELVRITKDLAKNGEATLRDGTKLKAGTGSLNWHSGSTMTGGSSENRKDFNIIFQSAVMRNVALIGGDRAFGNAYIHDLADYNVNNDNGDSKSVRSGDSAANPVLLTSLSESIMGKSVSNKVWNAFDKMKEAANTGKQPIALYSADRVVDLHYVVIQKVDDKDVYFQNTQSGTLDSMPVAEFKKRLKSSIIDD
ncbi:MAG: hypothetical protein H7263_05365 [Candidatus Sericytochromatia bacterium]|nr:hypothetical protein [Candidatus Sericytochromatia bacterium]